MRSNKLALAVVVSLISLGQPLMQAHADDDNAKKNDFGMAGLLSKKNQGEIPALTLSAGKPLTEHQTIELKSGTYYKLEVTSDGSQELALAGSEFFRAIWIDEIVINGIEIRPMGVSSLEFDDPGTAKISFVAIKPGSYKFGVPGRESQTVEIQIK